MADQEAKAEEAPEFERDEGWDRKHEMICGVLIAVFAAALAITDLGGGRYGDDELLTSNNRASAYAWYQSKSIKASLVKSERELLVGLLDAGAIEPTRIAPLRAHVKTLDNRRANYDRERREILLGSAAVGKANWAQESGGELGKIVGAKPLELREGKLGAVGDIFDLGTFFLQLCLVMGAISLVLEHPRPKLLFLVVMNLLGITGIIVSSAAFIAVTKIP